MGPARLHLLLGDAGAMRFCKLSNLWCTCHFMEGGEIMRLCGGLCAHMRTCALRMRVCVMLVMASSPVQFSNIHEPRNTSLNARRLFRGATPEEEGVKFL